MTASLTGFSLRSGGKPLARAAYFKMNPMLSHLIQSRGPLLFILCLIGLWVVSPHAAYAQPIAPPHLLAGMLPDWVGAIGAALIVGGILFLILSAIGASLGRRLGRPVIERVFNLLGTAAWIAVFMLFLFVL